MNTLLSIKKNFTKFVTVVAATAITAGATAADLSTAKVGYLIPTASVGEMTEPNEHSPEAFFETVCTNGTVITSNDVDKIKATELATIWVHIDRIGLTQGVDNLPFSDATIAALKTYVEEGGNLYLSKHATQLITALGRVSDTFAPNIYSNGEGSLGTDVWAVNAQIGYYFHESDPSQFYDHRTHAVFNGLTTFIAPAASAYEWETYPFEGTSDGSEMWREDHNCKWDFNAYSYTSDGANTVEKFQNDTESVVLGAWGHVQDHACAGIIEFLPTTTCKGRIIANGLAAYEWNPQSGSNAYQSNIELFTTNTLGYLVDTNESCSSVETIAPAATSVKLSAANGAIRYAGAAAGSAISVYAVDGRLLASTVATAANGEISVEAKGLVIVKVASSQGAASKKIIIK